MAKRKRFEPSEKDFKPELLENDQIQYWTRAGTMMGLLPRAKAQDMVRERTAWVSSHGSITLVRESVWP